MSEHTTNAIVQTAKLVTLGDAIRAKAGLSAEMTLDEMATAVANIQTGGTYQSKTVSPSTTQQTVSPDAGYDALSSVTVNAMPSGSATTPATSITANPTISVSASGLITASVSGSKSVTPSVSAGYVSSGTAGTVTVNGSATSQLTVYNGEHHEVLPSGYNVTVALTDPSNPSYFTSCKIYECEEYVKGSLVGQLNSPAESNSVLVSTNQFVIEIRGSGYFAYGLHTTTGGIVVDYVDGGSDGTNVWCNVSDDGTITISGIDYDD